jgi:hypothetical protein
MMNQWFSSQEISTHLTKKLTIVSVGSGMGVTENALIKDGYKVICIDPTKNKSDPYTNNTMTKQPDYSSVKEYMSDVKNPIGDDIHLLLNFPLPDYALYDICSIYDLQPKFVTIKAGYYGHSGTLLLQIWLRQCGVDTQGKIATEINWAKSMRINWNSVVKQKYVKLKYQQKCQYKDERGSKPIQEFLTTLMRKDKVIPSDSIELYTPTMEEVVQKGQMNIMKSLERCLQFIAQRLTDSNLNENIIKVMLQNTIQI